MLAILLLIIGLCIISYEDFRYRAISIWVVGLVFLLGIYHAFINLNWEWHFLVFNLSFIFVQFWGLSLYFSIKQNKIINITKKYIGTGDLVFFIAISPLFSPLQFCFFFVFSLILILFLFVIFQAFSKRETTIPLAGLMSVVLIFYLTILCIYSISPYDDWFLMRLIYG